ncbi:hypothetical protein [Yinghuangia soli]|uniref:Uncharacterized protein n=1 Tax=Yinghuangia soli TaxID=2908204 RepID=A0AA41U2C2_9ACTN|nr:hypothetical protein [Yinghuangia soli]MCF2531643.1 hypothetical protein [Yinghuangia soli]
MTEAQARAVSRVREPLTRKNKIGLGLAVFLGLIGATSFFGAPGGEGDSEGPPQGVLIADGVLGVITLIAVVYAWRTADRTGSRIVAGSRILAAVTSLPAFFVEGVPAFVVALVAVLVVVTAVTVALVLSRPAPESGAPAAAGPGGWGAYGRRQRGV